MTREQGKEDSAREHTIVESSARGMRFRGDLLGGANILVPRLLVPRLPPGNALPAGSRLPGIDGRQEPPRQGVPRRESGNESKAVLGETLGELRYPKI